ncbi:PREDICTED: uncharacterized protein CXorf66 homolog [Miniopterus natalensis]|uniref:uncharacterized protein CXorf66 homolog n=1 Tax=Miniopterus natalensis TaxID=291302 RepID=UPI0007A6E764|nr:PREDICTED: uncharacterized protein CXorf66 homolog [Miniopterus natalensis]
MNLFIYVLLLSIWTNSCLNANQSDGSSTTGANEVESEQTEMDDYRKRIFVIVVGVMSTAFICTSFCCLHYNCLSKDVPKEKPVQEDVAAKSSKSSKMSLSKHKTAHQYIPEKQPMLSGIETLSEPSSPERSSRTSGSVSEKSSIPSSTEKFIKPSSPKRVSRSSHLGKSYKKHRLEKSHKLAYAYKLGSHDHSSYPNRAVRPPSPASLQYPHGPTKPHHSTCRHNQILLPKSSSLKKFTKCPRHHNLKRAVIAGRADMLSKSPLVNSCPYYKEKHLAHRATTECLVSDIYRVKNTNAQNIPFPREVKPFSKSFRKVDSRDNAIYGNVKASDNESEREVTIFCNISLNEITRNRISSNRWLSKNKKPR